ncbi:hypothetical protein [Gimesia alba]|uniref:hypothetical protein n=1 Tax=Gimesia alba TaxID=2527973 RepID=UPI0018D8321C|nr:hypothetical protein [Gimesia alba]
MNNDLQDRRAAVNGLFSNHEWRTGGKWLPTCVQVSAAGGSRVLACVDPHNF